MPDQKRESQKTEFFGPFLGRFLKPTSIHFQFRPFGCDDNFYPPEANIALKEMASQKESSDCVPTYKFSKTNC